MKPVVDQTPADSAIAQPAFLHKLADAKGCAERLAALPRPWVFTNGVFDVLHRAEAFKDAALHHDPHLSA